MSVSLGVFFVTLFVAAAIIIHWAIWWTACNNDNKRRHLIDKLLPSVGNYFQEKWVEDIFHPIKAFIKEQIAKSGITFGVTTEEETVFSPQPTDQSEDLESIISAARTTTSQSSVKPASDILGDIRNAVNPGDKLTIVDRAASSQSTINTSADIDASIQEAIRNVQFGNSSVQHEEAETVQYPPFIRPTMLSDVDPFQTDPRFNPPSRQFRPADESSDDSVLEIIGDGDQEFSTDTELPDPLAPEIDYADHNLVIDADESNATEQDTVLARSSGPVFDCEIDNNSLLVSTDAQDGSVDSDHSSATNSPDLPFDGGASNDAESVQIRKMSSGPSGMVDMFEDLDLDVSSSTVNSSDRPADNSAGKNEQIPPNLKGETMQSSSTSAAKKPILPPPTNTEKLQQISNRLALAELETEALTAEGKMHTAGKHAEKKRKDHDMETSTRLDNENTNLIPKQISNLKKKVKLGKQVTDYVKQVVETTTEIGSMTDMTPATTRRLMNQAQRQINAQVHNVVIGDMEEVVLTR